MTKKLRLMMTMLLLAVMGSVCGAEKTITLDYSSFGLTTSYAIKSATVDGFGFTVDQGYKGSGNVIQMNSTKGSGILYNTTAISGLKSITVNVSSVNKTYTITTGTSEKPTTHSQTGTATETYYAVSGDTYFQLKVSGASYFSSIVITYDDGIETVATPTFSLNGGTYYETKSVSLFCGTDGAKIYYTINGSIPTTSSSVYSSPITVSETTTINAIAAKDGMKNSDVATATYTIQLPVDPVVSFATDPISVKVDKTFTNTINKPNDLAVTYSVTSGSQYATVDATTGKVTGVAEGQAIITASWNAVEHIYNAGSVSYTVNIMPKGLCTSYKKITSTDALEDGDYLIVYEGENVAFDGSLTSFDVTRNTKQIEIVDNIIEVEEDEDDFYFTIDVNSKTIQSASGYYIYRSANTNGLNATQSNTTAGITNTISITNGTATITGSGGKELSYNTANDQKRFRYLSSANIQLYKKDILPAPVFYFDDKTPSVTVSAGTYQQSVTTSADYDGTITWQLSNNTANATINSNGNVTFTRAGKVTVVATGSQTEKYGIASDEYTLTVVDPSVSTIYKKVTSTDELVVDKKYILVCESSNVGMGEQVEANYRDFDDITIDNNTVDIAGTSVVELTLVQKENNNCIFMAGDNAKYLSTTTYDGTYLESVENTTGDGVKWSVVGSAEAGYELQSVAQTARKIMYNTSAPRFATYKSGGSAFLYVQKEIYEVVEFETDGYKTYVTKNAIDWDATLARNNGNIGVHGYKVITFTDTEVNLTEFGTENNNEAVIPVETPIIIMGKQGVNLLVISNVTTVASPAGNKLIAAEGGETTTSDFTLYVLQKIDKNGSGIDNYNFFALKAGREMPARKAYLRRENSKGAIGGNDAVSSDVEPQQVRLNLVKQEDESLVSDDAGIPDGIKEVEQNADVNGEFYSISGVRIAVPTKGIYIVNGKKVLVK